MRRHCVGGSSVTQTLSRSMAAVVEDPFLEERRELTDGVLRQGQSHFVDVKGGRLRLEHHTEKLPEVFLGKDESEEYGQDNARVKEGRENAQSITDLHIRLFL